MRRSKERQKVLSSKVNRREFLKKVGVSAAAISAFSGFNITAESKERKKLVLIGHRVHETVAKGVEGGGKNLIKLFEERNDVDIVYHTYSSPEVMEKLFRIGPLNRTEEDIFHVVQAWAVPVLSKFLEPLDSYLKNKPIAGWPGDWPKPMVDVGTIMGKTYLIPVRGGCWALWYNRKLLKERGFDSPPKVAEDIYDIAKACTFTRPDGQKFYGWATRASKGDLFEPLVGTARMFGGHDTHLITPDLKITLTEPPVIQALELWQKMFKEGIMPPEMSTYSYPEIVKMFQEGRVALTFEPTNYWPTFNNPKVSKIAGEAFPAMAPISKNLKNKYPYSNGTAFIWLQGILRGSQRKDLAWEYIRHLASKESHLEMAKSGNSPPRLSVLSDPEYIKSDPGAEITLQTLKVSKVSMPAFPNVSEVVDIIGEHSQNVFVHGKSAMAEMKRATEKIEPLLQ